MFKKSTIHYRVFLKFFVIKLLFESLCLHVKLLKLLPLPLPLGKMCPWQTQPRGWGGRGGGEMDRQRAVTMLTIYATMVFNLEFRPDAAPYRRPFANPTQGYAPYSPSS
jgi:hypothetical protein